MNRETRSLLYAVMAICFAAGLANMAGLIWTGIGLLQSDGLLPALVFLWPLATAVPTRLTVDRIGARKTALIGAGVLCLSLLMPLAGESYPLKMTAVSLIAAGDTILLTALLPPVFRVLQGRLMAPAISLGTAVFSLGACTGIALAEMDPDTGYHLFGAWREMIMPVLAFLLVGTLLTLCITAIPEAERPDGDRGKADLLTRFMQNFSLLEKINVMLGFIGVMCLAGLSVGMLRILPEMGWGDPALEQATDALPLALLFLSMLPVGGLLGALLIHLAGRKRATVLCASVSIAGLLALCATAAHPLIGIRTAAVLGGIGVVMVSLGSTCLASVLFTNTLVHAPGGRTDDVSALLVMALFGGLVASVFSGLSCRLTASPALALFLLLGVASFLLYYAIRMKQD